MKTKYLNENEAKREWLLIDAKGATLGRLATTVATFLKGKHKAFFSPHQDMGDYVVIINAEQVHTTGNKLADKNYYRHSGYPGGIKSMSLHKMLDHNPTFVIEKAVKGMMPSNPLGRRMLSKLKVYSGESHPHTAQQPRVVNL